MDNQTVIGVILKEDKVKKNMVFPTIISIKLERENPK
jgi:hypothetical protein